MSRHDNADDDLGGFDQLSNRQQWAVSRYRARAGRHHRDRIEPTNRDRWSSFQRAEQADENERFRRS